LYTDLNGSKRSNFNIKYKISNIKYPAVSGTHKDKDKHSTTAVLTNKAKHHSLGSFEPLKASSHIKNVTK
jgi:hypothetical protein